MSLRRALRNRSISELLEWGFRRSIGLATASQRVLPDFIIIGAQRCGTTSLYKYLCQHPEVYPSFPKEIHYFSNYYQKGINWYRSHFPLLSVKSRNTGPGKGKFLTGEATPYYLPHPHAPRRAASVVPEAILIILLRDPVKRAYSHYFHEVQMGVEKLSFEKAISKEVERLDHEFDRMTEDENYRSFNYQHFSYLARGEYADQIERWMQYYTADRTLFLNSDHLNSDPSSSFLKVTRFLGLNDWNQVDFSRYHTASYPKMDQKTREQLYQYFKPHNKKLYDLCQIDFGLDERK